ncbi:uncharacterized protein LOC141629899 [Silene latifolia]|uniref:uncharacterized protein LOC141629899 n=1 Tax=Silene latifolia TaxID=37657 RepID=UPI003D781699
MGPLPRAYGNRAYMQAMTDYFSKWIEAEAFPQIQEKHVISFIKRNISNGQAESSNKIVMNNLKRRLEDIGGNWADELPFVLWSNRTTPKVATGQTPFSLVYGAEAVIPSEV